LAASLSQRQAAGLPVPDVTISQQAAGAPMLAPGGAGGSYAVTTTTTLTFAGPEEAGYSSWPQWTLDESFNPSGALGAGGYIEQIKAAVAAQNPVFGIYMSLGTNREPIFLKRWVPASLITGAGPDERSHIDGSCFDGIHL
jgi:hypothetical protein